MTGFSANQLCCVHFSTCNDTRNIPHGDSHIVSTPIEY